MKAFLTTIILLAMAVTQATAVPAKRKPFTVRQADGTTLTLRLTGDEHFHYHTTADGIPVCIGADGNYHYARLDGGQLQPSGIRAHDAALRTAEETAYVRAQAVRTDELRQLAAGKRSIRSARRAQRAAQRRAKDGNGFIGEKKGLVILVNFSDKKFAAGNTQSEFDDMMNQTGYTKNGNGGSVHDYFLAQSYGKFSLTFDVVGPVTLPQKMSYYGANDRDGNDMRPGEMVAEACMAVSNMVDFADYDWDGDGEVEQVYVIYAGYSEAAGAAANTVWPHEWGLSWSDYGRTLTIDGVTINTYACSSELNGISGTRMDGIGTTCHEFSHCLGLPDFYDTEYNGNFGMDSWSVMDYGSYNGDGYVPASYTAYERMFAGWLEPVELESGRNITDMRPITEAPEAYIVRNSGNSDEYYLLENHQQRGWDSEAYGHGLLVLHVDYDANAWYNNEVNNSSAHQRMTVVPADNQFKSGYYEGDTYATAEDLEGDPYPGTSGNNSLTDTSRPAAKLFSAAADGRKFLGKPIENITENAAGLISFTFMGGTAIEAPVAAEATSVTATEFTANWNAVEGAESYILEVRERNTASPEENLVLSEDFSGFADIAKDGSTDISTKLDDYMRQKGWTGTKLFASPSRIKVGSSKQNGTLITPALDAPASGSVTLGLVIRLYGLAESTHVEVRLLSAGGTTLQSKELTLYDKGFVVFEGVEDGYKIGIYPKERIYVAGLNLYDGSYGEEELEAVPARRAKASVRLIEDITDTQYTVGDLTPGATYSYRVKAVAELGSSAWSNAVTVSLVTGIGAPTFRNDAPVEVFAADGRRLRRSDAASWSTGLPSGTYIVRQGETAGKFVVR